MIKFENVGILIKQKIISLHYRLHARTIRTRRKSLLTNVHVIFSGLITIS